MLKSIKGTMLIQFLNKFSVRLKLWRKNWVLILKFPDRIQDKRTGKIILMLIYFAYGLLEESFHLHSGLRLYEWRFRFQILWEKFKQFNIKHVSTEQYSKMVDTNWLCSVLCGTVQHSGSLLENPTLDELMSENNRKQFILKNWNGTWNILSCWF